MKLLFDENTSPQLVQLLADIFPESLHVRDAGLQSATDETFGILQSIKNS
jgi:predicted nuclease of predicted toxin-antitoxin system